MGSLVGLVATLAAAPYVLLLVGGDPLPDHMPTPTEVTYWLSQPSLATTEVALVVLRTVLWLLWVAVVVAVVAELVGLMLRIRVPRWRPAVPLQGLAAGLVGGLTVTASGGVAHASPPAADLAASQPVDPDTSVSGVNFTLAEPPVGSRYRVTTDDYLGEIADRFLGRFDDYPQLARLNGLNDPDRIDTDQELRLPATALDRGARPHANGTVQPVPAPAPPGSVPDSNPQPGPSSTPSSPAPTPPPAADTAPTRNDDAGADRQPTNGQHDSSLEQVTRSTALVVAGGIVGALVTAELSRRRRRVRQYRRLGYRLTQPADPPVARAMRVAARPLDVERVNVALRTFGHVLPDTGDTPDVAAVAVDADAVHLILAEPAAAPPPPFECAEGGTVWTVPTDALLVAPVDAACPLPLIASVGSQHGVDYLLLDLERAGVLSIEGDPSRAQDLLRYLAVEAATSPWTDDVHVVLVGFDEDDGRALVEFNPARVQRAESAEQALQRALRQAIDSPAALREAGMSGNVAARLGPDGLDGWAPLLVCVAEADEPSMAMLGELDDRLAAVGRCGVAVVVIAASSGSVRNGGTDRPWRWRLTVGAEGELTVDWLSVRDTVAAGLPRTQMRRMAHLLRQARQLSQPQATPVTVDEPVPPAPEAAPWARGTDAHGAPQPRSPVHGNELNHRGPDTDPDLDADLRAWRAAQADRPRIGILGPVTVEAPGIAPVERRRFYSEIIVYLAQRGTRGATGDQIDEAIWPDRPVAPASRRVAITQVRRWLGETSDGEPWLPVNIGGNRAYRLRDSHLLDWQLFRRLRTRGLTAGAAGLHDLRSALELVRGEPLADCDRRTAAHNRNPYTWLLDSDINPDHLTAAIVDTSHELVERSLADGDTYAARWAVEQAWRADPHRTDDHPWLDLMRIAHREGHTSELRALLDDLVRTRDVEVPEELNPTTYELIDQLAGDWLRSPAR